MVSILHMLSSKKFKKVALSCMWNLKVSFLSFNFRFMRKPLMDIRPSSCALSAISFNQKTSGMYKTVKKLVWYFFPSLIFSDISCVSSLSAYRWIFFSVLVFRQMIFNLKNNFMLNTIKPLKSSNVSWSV